MAKKYDGWMAKDKDGEFWRGTFRKSKEAVESYLETLPVWRHLYKFEIVKVKYVEVK